VLNTVPDARTSWPEASMPFESGMLLAVEPMIAAGTSATRQKRGHWPILTADGSPAVHYEANVLITREGPHNLTAGLDDLPDIVGTGGA
jgi:methionyl aminopeptidase